MTHPAEDADPARRRPRVVRRGLRMVLDAEPDLEVVAEAGDGAEAVGRRSRATSTWRSSTSRCRA